jgi:hypothetical protein
MPKTSHTDKAYLILIPYRQNYDTGKLCNI